MRVIFNDCQICENMMWYNEIRNDVCNRCRSKAIKQFLFTDIDFNEALDAMIVARILEKC